MPNTKDMIAIFIIAVIASLFVAYCIGHIDWLAELVALEQD